MILSDSSRFLEKLEAIQASRSFRKIDSYYPKTGPLRRELYPKQMDFFRAGIEHRERLLLAANRVGKTEGVGAYEITLHATGVYPEWWPGYRFDRPVKVWACGDTAKTVRDIIQEKTIGPKESSGTGMFPGHSIVHTVPKAGVPDAIEIAYLRHAPTGKNSVINFKSYDQGRRSFQGTEQDIIWLDEEPPLDIYTECLLRTMDTGKGAGLLLCTFTPIQGLTELVLEFLPGGKAPE
jgi:phage terminase large subunit-like protein